MTSIAIGWLDNGITSGAFTESITQLTAYETAKARFVTTVRVQSGPQMAEGRNELVERFLTTQAEWLFMVDSDMTFIHDSVERLLQTADDHESRMVGGLAFGVNREYGQFPTIYNMVAGMPVVMLNYPRNSVIEVDATGAAFTIVHRSLFESYRRPFTTHTWFHRQQVPASVNDSGEVTHEGGVLGEDLSWCIWLREQGISILVDTSIQAGHVKTTQANEATYSHPEDIHSDSDVRT